MNPSSPAKRILLGALRPLLGSYGAPPPVPDRPRRILVVRQHDQLGDIICSLPVLEALRNRYPGAEITFVTRPPAAGLMEGHPFIDRVLVSEGNSFASLGGLFAALREKEHDLAIVPATVSVSLTSNLIAKLSGAPVRIGPGSLEGVRNPSGYLFTHPIDLRWPQKRHQTLKNLDILAPLGIDAGTASGGVQPVLGGMEDLAPRADGLLAELRADLRAGAGDSGRKIVGIHPGAAKPQNRWPVASYIELVSRLHERGWGVVVTIGPRDKEVHDAMQNQLRDGTKYLVNEPLRLVAAVVNKLDYFISNDTGVLHMAGALKVPTLGLYGPTDPAEWGPPGEKNRHLRSPDGDVSHLSVDEVYNCFLNYT